METSREAPAFASRWCASRFVSPGGHGTSAYLRTLEEVMDRTAAPLLIPSHDGTIALLRKHRERLERHIRIALAGEGSMAIAVNKARTLAVAAELGIDAPGNLTVANPDDLEDALDAVGLPAVIKPCESWIGEDGHGIRVVPQLVTTPEEAERVVRDLTRFGGTTLYQRFVGGRREAVSLLYAHGTVYARFAQWAQRTFPPLGGDSVLRESIPVPKDIGDQAEALIRAIDLEGYSEIEFRRDEEGTPYLMEINPRLSASVEIAVRSGVDFPFLLKQWALGDAINRVERYRTGVWMRYLGGDIRGTLETIRQRGRPGLPRPRVAARDFAAAFLRPMGYDYFQWQDPLPALLATVGFLRHASSQVLKKDRAAFRRKPHGTPGEGETPPNHAPRTS